LFQLAFLQGDTAAMQEQLAWPRANGKPEEALSWEAQVATFSGELALADQLSNRIVEMSRTGDAKEPMAQALMVNALRDATLGSCDRAIKQAKQALDLSREQGTIINAASTYATCGQASLAQPLIDELDRQWPVDTLLHTTSIPIIRAQMDLARGNAASAVQLLEAARKYEAYGDFWPQYLRGQAYLKQNNGAQAATEFKTILDHRGWYPLSPLYPLAQLGFARAAAMNGDRPGARKAYQDFLALWKDADASLPALVAAHAEYEKVK
jgi:tetratricopeptide (TPR) repeat protein